MSHVTINKKDATMETPPKAGCGFTMAFLIFVLVMGCLLFVDCRMVHTEHHRNFFCWLDEDSDDEWEQFDTIRIGRVQYPKDLNGR
jgi:hypothetical protein